MVAVRAVDTGVRADHFWSLLFVCDAVRTMFTVAHVKQTAWRRVRSALGVKDLSEEIFFRRSSNLLVIRERSLFRCLCSMLRRPRVCILCGAAEFECALGVWIVDKIIQCTDLADLEAFEAEGRTDFFGVSRDEERAFVELQNQFALRFQQLVLESKAFSSTTERLERLERKFDGLLLAISSLKAQRQSRRRSVTSERQRQRRSVRVKRRRRRRSVTSSAPRNLLRSQSDVWSVKCVSAPSAPKGCSLLSGQSDFK